MLVPPASRATTSTATNTKPTSSDDSVIDNAPRPRLKRSTSCGHFSNTALNLTRTTFCDKSNDHISSSISTSLSSSLVETNTSCALTDDSNFVNQMPTSSIYTLSGNADITTTIDPSTKTYNELNHQLSYTPVLIDLTNNVPFPSSRTQSMYQTTPISLPQGVLISPASQNLETLRNSISSSSSYQSHNSSNTNSISFNSSKPIDALTNVIEKYMTSTTSQTTNKGKRRSIERQCGESLTTMDVLMRLQQKQKAKKRKTTKPLETTLHVSKKRCGWKYFHVDRHAKGGFKKKPSTRKTISSRSNYLYRSPCGRSLLTLDEIEQYLLQTNSKLTIKFFVDDRQTRLEPCIKYESQYILNDDITQGKEYVRIPVYNENNSNLPETFIYGTETRSKLIFPNDTTTMTCCSCTDNCRNRIQCPCWLKTFEQAKLNDNEKILNWQRQNFSDEQMISRFAYIHQRLKTPVWSGIYECNSKCLCHTKQCTNRLVQNSLYQQLQLFHTNTKGWALRVLHDIPYGSFINAYVGELITEEIATKRDFKYLAILDHKSHLNTTDNKKRKASPIKNKLNNVGILNGKSRIPVKHCVQLLNDSQTDNEDDDNDEDDDDSCFILDAKHYGSISRFYNHSCKPNVHIQNVFINTHDPQFPVIALFACRNIRAGEEICWDYNYTVGCMPNVRIDCQCQASNCRGRLL
ncbi:unnamed protein product [Rotaria sp. Silwood2]|nr:unnamed protein product [Rotaria sp. Silwood2]